MKSTEFAYWLQGWFEIGEGPLVMSSRQKQIIRKHLDMVLKHDSSISPFCAWVDGVLTALGENDLDAEMLAKVQERLNNQFLHVIDKSYPAEQQKVLNIIHGNDSPGAPKMRC